MTNRAWTEPKGTIGTMSSSHDHDFEPIALEIMWSRLISIADEMWTTVLQTAVSTIIGAFVAAMLVLQVAGESIQPWVAAALAVVTTLSAGIATLGCHALDSWLETRHQLIDAKEKLDAKR